MKTEPLVMCLTNEVASEFTANVLLAIGAKPAMVKDRAAAIELAQKADAALINLGTVDAAQADAMRAAIATCNQLKKPWVLDPVACQVLDHNASLAKEFLALSPTVVRGNKAEVAALLKAEAKATRHFTFLATDAVDTIGNVRGTLQEVRGGVKMLQSVTATGCAQGAICAAALAWGKAPVEAALWASKLMKSAGERAWTKTRTPGSFRVALVDALWELTHD